MAVQDVQYSQYGNLSLYSVENVERTLCLYYVQTTLLLLENTAINMDFELAKILYTAWSI